jgi:hypothetical protein
MSVWSIPICHSHQREHTQPCYRNKCRTHRCWCRSESSRPCPYHTHQYLFRNFKRASVFILYSHGIITISINFIL